MSQNFARNRLVMLSVSYAGKNTYSADKTNGLLRVDAFLVNTDTCWPIVPTPPLKVYFCSTYIKITHTAVQLLTFYDFMKPELIWNSSKVHLKFMI